MPRRPRIPEPEPPETDPELEQIIAELIERKYAASKGQRGLPLSEARPGGLALHSRAGGPDHGRPWIRGSGALCARIPLCPIQKERCCHCSARDAGDEPVLTKL